MPAQETEGTTLPVPGIGLATPVACGDLVRIGGSKPVIDKTDVSVMLTPLTADANGVRIEADTTSATAGLYVSELVAGSGVGEMKRPVQLYVSKARRLPG